MTIRKSHLNKSFLFDLFLCNIYGAMISFSSSLSVCIWDYVFWWLFNILDASGYASSNREPTPLSHLAPPSQYNVLPRSDKLRWMCDVTAADKNTCQGFVFMKLSRLKIYSIPARFNLCDSLLYWRPGSTISCSDCYKTFIRAAPQSNLVIDRKLYGSEFQEPCPGHQLPLPIKWKPFKTIKAKLNNWAKGDCHRLETSPLRWTYPLRRAFWEQPIHNGPPKQLIPEG